MRNALIVLACTAVLACAQDEPAPTAKPGGTSAPAANQAAATTAASSDSVLSAQVREVASSQATIELMELRLDEAGAVVKQAAYHDDANAIPEAVRTLAADQFPGSKTTRYETEHYADRGPVYEVEVETAEGKRCEVAANAEGVLLYVECEIAPAELPEAVASQVASAMPEGKVVEAEHKRSEDEGESYSVEVEAGAREYYLRLAADGTLLTKHLRVPALVEIPVP